MKNKFIMLDFSKKKNFLAKINLFLLLICSFIGVGFVSGAEIYEFFVRFKSGFIFGIIVFFILVYLIIYKMLCISKLGFCNMKFNKKKNKIKVNNVRFNRIKTRKIYVREFVFLLNVFVVASAMFSGLKYFLEDIFIENYLKIYIFVLFIVFVILVFGVKYLQIFDYIVITFIFALVLFFLIKTNIKIENIFNGFSIQNGLFSMCYSSLYIFMNLFQLKPLIDLSEANFKNKKECKIFSIIFTFILLIILIVFILVLKSNENVCGSQMPFLEFFKTCDKQYLIVFCFGLVISIISTQVSSLLGVKTKISKIVKFSNFNLSIFSFFVCLIFGLIPFQIFVSIFYPVLGVINLFVFVFC